MESIKTLRAMTGAGLADVKKALTEADGDMDRAKEILRERGQAIAAKRSDRETANGCVLTKSADGFSAIIALKCEIDMLVRFPRNYSCFDSIRLGHFMPFLVKEKGSKTSKIRKLTRKFN